MSDKEALDRLTNEIPGDIIIDGHKFMATNIVNSPRNNKLLEITCFFVAESQVNEFIRMMEKPYFNFSVPGFIERIKAKSVDWWIANNLLIKPLDFLAICCDITFIDYTDPSYLLTITSSSVDKEKVKVTKKQFKGKEADVISAFQTVYAYLTAEPITYFAGKYDALHANLDFICGVNSVMEVIADMAGKLEEFNEIWSKNAAKSEEKARKLRDTNGNRS